MTLLRCLVMPAAILCAAPLAQAQTPKAMAMDYIGRIAAKLEPSRVIAYKKVGERTLHLNVFDPEGWKPTDRRACFLTIHGGGWTGLDPRRQYPFAAHFARLGMVGISVQYRLARPNSDVTVFDCVKDARSSLRYVRSHAAELGIDPQKIVVNGGSAGGHLAAATALFDGVDDPNDDASVSCVPNAMVLFFPVIDTSLEGYGNKLAGPQWREISPLHRVRPGAVPTILFHGDADTVTPFKGAAAFRDAMLKAGNRCELDVRHGATHGYLMRERDACEDALRKTETFLQSLKLLPATLPVLKPGESR